jgi:prepilin-type N-terminal cleavage/methylation domain-containing protein
MIRIPRRGFTLVEIAVAAGLLGVLLGALGQFVSRWEAARHAAAERVFALRFLENVLERAAVGETDVESQSSSPELAERLRSPELRVTPGEPDDVGLIPVTASLSWRNAQGERVSPVVLTAWRAADSVRQEGGR